MWLLVLALLLPATAHAECYTIDKAPLDAECVVMTHGSVQGVWLRLDKADELRKLKLESAELELRLDKQDKLIATLEDQSQLLHRAVDTQGLVVTDLKKENELLVRQKNDAVADARDARASADAWYRSPWLWFGVGVFVTGAATTTIVMAVH